MNSGQSHVIGFAFAQRANGMSHPDPYGPPDRTPIQIGEVWETPITGEYAKILELPYRNPEGRAVAELLARVGARVAGEHRHPGIVERFTVRRSESRLGRCDRKARRPDKHSSPRGECHYRTGYMARLVERERPRRPLRVEVTPGERFAPKHYLASRGLGIPTLRVCRICCSSR
jgi:hypothetical protein